MFESLIEEPQVSQQLLNKLTTEFINKHDAREDYLSTKLSSDLTSLSQQLRLYGQALQQLSPHTVALKAFHHQLFRLLDFLARFTNHMRTPYQPQSVPTALCRGCQTLVQHRNIRQLYRELVDCRLMSVDRQERESAVEGLGEWDEVANKECLVQRMGKLQQNITERQINLNRCIDDFEIMRNQMMLGLRKRDFDRDFDSFDMKTYALQLATHFLSSLSRVQQKINQLKRSIQAVEDQGFQTISLDTPFPAKNEQKLLTNRSEADFRRMNDHKIRFQENSKRYQLELREGQIKIEALQSQNKNLREEVNNQKLKREAKEKAVRMGDKEEKLKQEERVKRQSFKMLMAGDNLLSGQFETRFLENYAINRSKKMSEEDTLPIIKATFKRTFEGFFNNRLSMNLNHRPLPSPSVSTPTRESGSIERRRNSRKKTVRIQLDSEAVKELSRFGHAYNYAHKQVHSELEISSQVNYKIVPKTAILASPALQTASSSSYKKSLMHTEGNVKHRRNNYTNLQSIISEMKQNQRQNSNGRQQKTNSTKKYVKSLQTEHLPFPTKTGAKKRKDKLSRNHSTLIDGKYAHQDQLQKIEERGLQLQGLKLAIKSSAVKQFVFQSELEEQPTSPLPAFKRDQPLYIDSLSGQMPLKKQKIILNLQEINYLTNLYSLLARIHMVDSQIYNKLKRWILSKGGDRVQVGRQSMVLKQIYSEIVFKHRQCRLSASLCPHLTAFLREMESMLRGVSLA